MDTHKPEYDVIYFLNKFSAIPDERWVKGHIGYKHEWAHCALGHCTQGRAALWEREPEALALELICGGSGEVAKSTVAAINDGEDHRYQQPTPKARILAALHDIKARAEAELEAYESRELKPSQPINQPVEV